MPKKNDAPARPVAVPQKLATQGPDSGPYPDEVIRSDAVPAPADTDAPQSPSEKKGAKALESEKSAREVKVVATRRGYFGTELIEPGTVFTIKLEKSQAAPSWVKPVDEKTAPTPPTHSAEAEPEVQ